MHRAIAAVAFLASLVSLLVIAGGGAALLAIENSGERGVGALLALGGLVAFAAVGTLVFAKKGTFASGLRRAGWRSLRQSSAQFRLRCWHLSLIRFAGLPFDSRHAA